MGHKSNVRCSIILHSTQSLITTFPSPSPLHRLSDFANKEKQLAKREADLDAREKAFKRSQADALKKKKEESVPLPSNNNNNVELDSRTKQELKDGLAEMTQLVAALESSLSTAETQVEKLQAAIGESKALKEKENEKRDQQGGPHRPMNRNKNRNNIYNRNRGSNNNRLSGFQYNNSNTYRKGEGIGGRGRGYWPGGGGDGPRYVNPGRRYEEDGKGLERAVKLLQEEMGSAE